MRSKKKDASEQMKEGTGKSTQKKAPPVLVSLTVEESNAMMEDSALKEKPWLPSFFNPRYKVIGLILALSALAVSITHAFTKFPDVGKHGAEWELISENIFLLGMFLRAASRKKNEDAFVNNARIRAFASASVFTIAINCIPGGLLMGQEFHETPLHIFMFEFLILFYLSFWGVRHHWKRKLFGFFGIDRLLTAIKK